ncbi:hypothetical protein I6F15_30390 [Bradyrhizobium sp. BRP14]|nr:hypothetical protein [Bradyrhizobium sp. BRP14]
MNVIDSDKLARDAGGKPRTLPHLALTPFILLKNLTAPRAAPWFSAVVGAKSRTRNETMTQRTCAACDCELDQQSIKVKLGGKTVEVCCEECAAALGEAEAAKASAEAEK